MRRFTRHPSLLPSYSLANRSQLPKSPGVYYLIQWWRPWRVLYVGMSGQMNERWCTSHPDRQHHKLKQVQHLSGLKIHFRTTKTRPVAQRLEAIDIMRYKPVLNGRYERHHSPLHDIVDTISDLGVLAIAAAIGWVLLRLLGW